jgi:hypothetical protein
MAPPRSPKSKAAEVAKRDVEKTIDSLQEELERLRHERAERADKASLSLFPPAPPGNERPMAEHNSNGRSDEAEHYRQAATDALEMLDWCIGYLVGTRKERIASQLAQGRAQIRKDLMHEAEEPLPTSKAERPETAGHEFGSAMRMRGLEPPRAEAHTDLNRARLPIPPHPRGATV